MEGKKSTVNNEISDVELLKQLKLGDRVAFSAIYERYGECLYRIIYYKTENKDEARDVLHDVFERLWTNRNTLRPDIKLFSYLFRAVHNRTLDLARHAITKQKYIDSFQQFVHDYGDINLQLEHKEILEIIRKSLETLPANTRKIMELKILEGFDNKEIAALLSLSDDSIKSHVKRGMKVLRKNEKYWLILLLADPTSLF